jgi:hypothetical protein
MKFAVLLVFTILGIGDGQILCAHPKKADTEIQHVWAAQSHINDIETEVAARKADLIQTAKFYNIDLTKQDWVHEQATICPGFSKHFFLLYYETNSPNGAFMAVYPRAGGRIQIVRRTPEYTSESQFTSLRKSTIEAFNAIWLDEQHAPNLENAMANLDWTDIARCYAAISGERPSFDQEISDSGQDEQNSVHHDMQQMRISRVSIQILGKPSVTTSLSLEFDDRNAVKRVLRIESAKIVGHS